MPKYQQEKLRILSTPILKSERIVTYNMTYVNLKIKKEPRPAPIICRILMIPSVRCCLSNHGFNLLQAYRLLYL